MNKKTRFNLGYWAFAALALLVFQYFYMAATRIAELPYSSFERLLDEGRIAKVAVSDRFIQGRFVEPVDGRPMFVTTRVEPDLARLLADRGVVVTGRIESTFLRDLLSWVLPAFVLVALWALMLRAAWPRATA